MKLALFDLRPGLAGSASVVGDIVPTPDIDPAPVPAEDAAGDDEAEAQHDCKSR